MKRIVDWLLHHQLTRQKNQPKYKVATFFQNMAWLISTRVLILQPLSCIVLLYSTQTVNWWFRVIGLRTGVGFSSLETQEGMPLALPSLGSASMT